MRRFIFFLICLFILIFNISVWAKEERIFLRLDPGGHTAIIRDLFFFDHGRKLISASDDKTIRIWDVSDLTHPKLIKTIRGEIGRGFGEIYAIAVDPKGKFLAVGGFLHGKDWSLRHAVRLHDLKTGRVVQVLKGHENAIAELAFSPDGRYLASGSADCSVIIWKRDGNRFKFYKRLKGHTNHIYALSFSSDRLASGSDDNTVRLYDVNDDFRLIKVLRDHKNWVCAVSFSPDGRYLVTGSYDKRILLYDKDGNFIKEFSKKETVPEGLSFSPDGRFLLAGSYMMADLPYDICYLYSFPSGEVVHAFKGHKNSVLAVASTIRDGKLILATGGGDAHEIFLWDKTGRVISQIKSVGSGIFSVAISSDARKIAFGFRQYEDLSIFNINNRGPLKYLFDLDKMKFKVLKDEKGLLRAMEKRGDLSLELNPDLSYKLGLYFSNSLLDVKKGNKVIARIIRHDTDGYRHDCFSFINDRFFVSGGVNGKVFVYNLRGEKVAELVGHEGEVWAVAVDKSGKWVVTGAYDQTINLFYVGDLKDVDWGSGGVDWGRLRKANPLTYKWWYPVWNKKYEPLKSQYPTIYRAYVNLFKSCYIPIRKIYPVLTIFPSRDGKEWVAWTPEGYFTASSPSALRLIGYHINQGFYHQARWVSFSQLYDVYFRPDLVRLKLARPTEDLSKYTSVAKVKEALETSPPPEVEIISPQEGEVVNDEWVTLKVRVKDKGGKIGDIRVYVNGKLSASEGIYRVARVKEKETPFMLASSEGRYFTRGGVRLIRRVWEKEEPVIMPKEFKPLSGTVEKVYRVRLVSGENIITVQAMNGENTILSGPATVRIKANVSPKPSRLFVLAIGVNEFDDPVYNLTYSLSDAEAVVSLIEDKAKGLYSEVRTRLLKNPRKQDVIDAFREFSKEMTQYDAFIFYAATHGEATDDRYWLITSDFRGELSERGALTSDEIMELMKKLPAQRQVMILDTCHAGAVDWTFLDLYEVRMTAFSLGSGMHVLSAASSFEFAKEGYHDHGYFTYFVLKALEGEADINNDKVITVVEMGPWVKREVEKVTHGIQRPVIRNVGKDIIMSKR